MRMVHPPLATDEPFRVEGSFDPRVAVMRLVPGQNSTLLRALARTDLVAVLLVAFGSGNLPFERRGTADAVRELVERGVTVAIGSQSHNGRVDLERYQGGRLAAEVGAVGTCDMTVEASIVKLMYLAGTLGDPEKVREALCVPIAGEITP